MLLSRHRGPLTADFRRFYSLRLLDVRAGTAGVTLTEFADLACYLPLESATEREIDPEWWVSPELQMLRDISYATSVLKWQPTADGHRNQRPPRWEPLTKAERAAALKARGGQPMDAMPLEEARALLGWAA